MIDNTFVQTIDSPDNLKKSLLDEIMEEFDERTLDINDISLNEISFE